MTGWTCTGFEWGGAIGILAVCVAGVPHGLRVVQDLGVIVSGAEWPGHTPLHHCG